MLLPAFQCFIEWIDDRDIETEMVRIAIPYGLFIIDSGIRGAFDQKAKLQTGILEESK